MYLLTHQAPKTSMKVRNKKMNINFYPSEQAVKNAKEADEPILVMVSFDCEEILVGPIDDVMEHHVLLAKLGKSGLDIDKYFRLVVDNDGADWTFVCPPDYKNITDKTRRIEAFYKDGFSAIPSALHNLGYLVGIDIPRRYRRHFNMLSDDSNII